MNQTLSEKVLSRAVGNDVHVGEIVVVPVDLAFAHDGTLPLAIQQMEAGLGTRRVADPARVAAFCDHASPSPSEKVSNVHVFMREFAAENGITNFFENGDGICHQLVTEKFAAPYNIIIGADSHTCTHGAMGAFATGMGSTDVAVAMAYGSTWLRVPESHSYVLDGSMRQPISSKDAILRIIGDIGADGATYASMEFFGPAVESMSFPSRMAMANMAVEAGAKTGMCPADDTTRRFLADHGRGSDYRELSCDPGAPYVKEYDLDCSDLEPLVAVPHRVDNVKPVTELAGTTIQQACLGSCTNGRTEDFEVAAKILKGNRVAPGVRLVVYPASRRVLLDSVRAGYIETLLEAGAAVMAPGCGFCIGRTIALGDGEVAISSQNRNFKGRMGNDSAFIYVASPATVAASALKGEIADPREVD